MSRTLPPQLWLVLLVLAPAALVPAQAERRVKLVGEPIDTLETVHVIGKRPRKDLIGLSKTIVSLDEAAARRFQPRTSSDALAAAPGVDVVKTGAWSARPSIRGLGGDRVLVKVDGVRLNTARGHGADAGLVSADRLAGVELTLGADAASHGSSALGGVVNLVTHRPLFADAPELELILGARATGPERSSSQHVAARMQTPRWGVEVRGRSGSLHAIRTPEGEIPDSGYWEEDLVARGVWRGGPVSVDLEHTHTAAHDIGLPAFASPAGGNAVSPLKGREATRLELRVDRDGWRPGMKLMGVRQRFDTEFLETTVDSVYVRRRLVAIRTNEAFDDYETVMTGGELALDLLGDEHLRVFGELHVEETEGPRTTDVTIRNLQGQVTGGEHLDGEMLPPATRTSGALGALGHVDALGFRLEPALRYDWFESEVDSTEVSDGPARTHEEESGSAQLGLSRDVRLFSTLWRPYARVATGFRAPALDERYFDGYIHGWLRVFGNDQLVAETSTTRELGIRAFDLLGGCLEELRVSVYRSDVDEMISLQYVGQLFLVPRFQYVNIERARLTGIEGELRFRLGRARLGLGFGLPEGEDIDTGERITEVGADRLTAEASVPVPYLPDGQLAARVRWHDAVDQESDDLDQDGFTATDLELGFRLLAVRTRISIHNVFNDRYRESLSLIPESGRVVAVSMETRFRMPFGGGRPVSGEGA